MSSRVEALQKVDEGKGTFLFFVGAKPGARVVELLPGLVQAAVAGVPAVKWRLELADHYRRGAARTGQRPVPRRCSAQSLIR